MPQCRILFIHFYFQLLEKFVHIQTFHLTEINFQFVQDVNFPIITLYNLVISRNQIQLSGCLYSKTISENKPQPIQSQRVTQIEINYRLVTQIN